MLSRGVLRLAVIAGTLARPAGAQTVRGAALDAVSNQPIAGADVHLLRGDSLIARATTDSVGRFTLRAGAGAGHRLRARRISYGPVTTAPFTLRRGQDTVITVRLQPRALPLEAVTVGAERSVRLVREGFYDRRARGFGYFRTPEELAAQNPLFLEDLFRGMSHIRIRRGRVVMAALPSCSLTVAVDGFVIRGGWTELIHAQEVEAVEVYRSPAGVPVWLAGQVSPCGAVVLWTKR